MAVRLSALRAGSPLPPGSFLVLISVRSWVDPRTIVRMEGLGQLKNPMTSSGIQPMTFRLVAWCINQLRYRVPLKNVSLIGLSRCEMDSTVQGQVPVAGSSEPPQVRGVGVGRFLPHLKSSRLLKKGFCSMEWIRRRFLDPGETSTLL
jgi:hypothetical protein